MVSIEFARLQFAECAEVGGLAPAMSNARPKWLSFALFNIGGLIISAGGKVILGIAADIERIVKPIEAKARFAASPIGT